MAHNQGQSQQQNQQNMQMRPLANRDGHQEAQLFYEFAEEFGRRQQSGSYPQKSQLQQNQQQ
ncbi:MAG: hypothetical protein ACOYD6_07295 [Limnochordia bacterium]